MPTVTRLPQVVNLSIIIVNWNTREMLRACIQSIHNTLDMKDVEIIVVDNASSDQSEAMVAKNFPGVKLIQAGQNLGFGKANNLAASTAEGKRLLLLNPDTELHPAAIPQMLEYLDSHPGVGMVGARLVNSDGSLQVSAHPLPTLGRECWRLFHLDRIIPLSCYSHRFWENPAARPVDVLMGACILLRREVYTQIGLFDERFFMYSEEVDLCKRVKQAGYDIHYLPDAVVTHHGGQSTRQVADEMFLELYKNKVRFFRKHYGCRTADRYKSILCLASYSRLAGTWIPGITSDRFSRTRLQKQYRLLLSKIADY